MKIYAIGGLGADKRVFDKLSLKHELIPLDWIPPLKNESLIDYCIRFSNKIDKSNSFMIMGVSFGGLVAVELAHLLKPHKTILISSVETKTDLRLVYKIIGKTSMPSYLPHSFFRLPKLLVNFLFKPKHKSILHQIIKDTDPRFIKWAITELLSWGNTKKIEPILKITSTSDRLMPGKKDKNTILVKNGGHFMIYDRADEISTILNQSL